MKTFSELKKNLKKDFNGKQKLKLALLGDTATQFFAQALRGEGFDEGLDLDVFDADFNQIDRQIFDNNSELYAHKPDIVVIFHSTHKLLAKYNKLSPEQQLTLADERLNEIKTFTSLISEQLKAKIVYLNYPEIDDAVFGNYANKVESSFLFQVRKLNYELMNFAARATCFFVCDMAAIQNELGKKTLFQPVMYVNTEMVVSVDAVPLVAKKMVDIVKSFCGKIKKCLVLDLDNTLWGGVVGDDGLENIQLGTLGIGKAFTEFQYWIKKLKNRGIILTVCSKNTENIAKEPFEKHPDMVLHLDDFAVFMANWDNKADNIKKIQQILNIGFDSMVFLDDNPFERNMVRENIPNICVPELPNDPAEYLEYLYQLNLFETSTYSNLDSERNKQYQVEAQRTLAHATFTDENDFLKSLNMVSKVEAFDKFNTPRVAQLAQRSNQFNLRTVRYTEDDVKRLADDINAEAFTFTLEDKFGDNGLIAVVVLKKESENSLFIDNWFMSCRVLKRGMENFILNTIVDFAKKNGFLKLVGEYLPTEKNVMVKDHYEKLGFVANGNLWQLNVADYNDRNNFIKRK
jgi:FkbH-like protein